MAMTSRERILTTLRHERPDRVPLGGWFRTETLRELTALLGIEAKDLEDALGLDWRGGGDCGVRWLEWEKRTDLSARHGDWPGAGALYLWHDERTFEDVLGCVQRVGRDGKYVGWVSGPLAGVDPGSREAHERLERIIPPHELESVESIAERVERQKARGNIVTGAISLPFKTAWHLRGMENLLCDYLLSPAFAHALLDRIYAFETERARRMAAAGVDAICVVGDIAGKNGTFFSLKTFREFMNPRLKRLVDAARAASPLERLYSFYHCDGDMWEVLPDLVDEVGIDIINPIQPECMDCYAVKERYGDRVTLHGTISVVDLLPNGPVDRIRQVVRERIDRLSYNGGFVLSSANAITYDTPAEHILAMYDEARNYTSDRWPKP